MDDCVIRIPWSPDMANKAELLLSREWLVANGLGGYASGTIAGVASRRYHSLLIAALPAPFGRRVMLNHLSELIRLPVLRSVARVPDSQPSGEGTATSPTKIVWERPSTTSTTRSRLFR